MQQSYVPILCGQIDKSPESGAPNSPSSLYHSLKKYLTELKINSKQPDAEWLPDCFIQVFFFFFCHPTQCKNNTSELEKYYCFCDQNGPGINHPSLHIAFAAVYMIYIPKFLFLFLEHIFSMFGLPFLQMDVIGDRQDLGELSWSMT